MYIHIYSYYNYTNLRKSFQMFTVSVEIAFQAQNIIQLQAPLSWSINKLKCFCATEVPSLKFDEFEFSFMQSLLQGDQTLGNLCQHSSSSKLRLLIKKVKSKTSLTKYYNTTMKKLFNEQIIKNFPIMSLNAVKQDTNIDEDEVIIIDIFVIWNSIKFLALYGFMLVLLGYGNLYHYWIVCWTICIYSGLEIYKKYRRREKIFEDYLRSLEQSEQKSKFDNRKVLQIFDKKSDDKFLIQSSSKEKSIFRGIIGILIMNIFKICEILICFLMTLFPNWSVKDHLDLFSCILLMGKRLVNNFKSGTYTFVKNNKNQ